MDKEKFYLQNGNLSEVLEFVWKDYFDKEQKGWNRIGAVFTKISTYISDHELYKFLRNNKEQRKEDLYDKKTEVNMWGKILVIQKPKGCKRGGAGEWMKYY